MKGKSWKNHQPNQALAATGRYFFSTIDIDWSSLLTKFPK